MRMRVRMRGGVAVCDATAFAGSACVWLRTRCCCGCCCRWLRCGILLALFSACHVGVCAVCRHKARERCECSRFASRHSPPLSLLVFLRPTFLSFRLTQCTFVLRLLQFPCVLRHASRNRIVCIRRFWAASASARVSFVLSGVPSSSSLIPAAAEMPPPFPVRCLGWLRHTARVLFTAGHTRQRDARQGACALTHAGTASQHRDRTDTVV